MLEPINETHWIIDVLLLKRKTLVIVEPRLFRRGSYSDALRLDDMEVIRASDDPKRAQSNNMAASLYWDPLLNEEFVFILKDSGTLEILDSELRVIDSFETEMEHLYGSSFLFTDSTSGSVFVKLSTNAIYSLALRRTEKIVQFIKGGGYPKCIYQAPGEILSCEVEWHVDLEAGGDFISIATLVQTDVGSGISFEVIRQTQKGIHNGKKNWESVIGLTHLGCLELKPSSLNGCSGFAALKTVPSVGFFIFAFNCTIFFRWPCGSQHSINGSRVVDFVVCNGLGLDWICEEQRDLVRLQSTVLLRMNDKGMEFTIFTNSQYVLSAKLDLIFEHPDEYTYEWGGVLVECATISGCPALEGFKNPAMDVFTIDPSVVLLWTRATGIICIDLTTMSQAHSSEFSQPSALYSGIVGYDFTKLVTCCGFNENKGTIQILSYGYEDLFQHKIETISFNDEIVNAWLTKDDLWWKTENKLLMNKELTAESNSAVTYVTWGDEKLTAADSVLIASRIWGDEAGNFVSLDKAGIVRWSMGNTSIKIISGKVPLDAEVHLACIKNHDGSHFTVINIENSLTFLSDDRITATKDLRPIWNSLSICSLFIVPDQELRYMLIGTNSGRITIFNLHQFQIEDSSKIGTKKVRFCGIPHSHYVFAYTDDDLLLVEVTREGECKLTKVHVAFKINMMVARNIGEIYIFKKGGSLSRLEIPVVPDKPTNISRHILVPSHCPTKFISFACSNRLIVTSSMRVTYNAAQNHNIYSGSLLLFDVDSQEQLFFFDLSEQYPQATISDIVAIPYQVPHPSATPPRKEPSYAKQLTLSRCFLVSLNYESAEDDSPDNLLLFSIDENKCTMDLHCGLKIPSTITALGNYHANMFIVAGETLQIFKVDYLLQENTFRVSQASNSISTCGYCTKVVDKPLGIALSKLDKTERISVLNLLEGLQEYSISADSADFSRRSELSSGYKLEPVPAASKDLPFAVSSTRNGRLIVDCATVLFEEEFWIAVACSDCCLEIYHVEKSDGEFDRQNNVISIRLDSEITSLATFATSFQKRMVSTRNNNLILSKTDGIQLFYVSTARGGIYALEEACLRFWMETEDAIAESDLEGVAE